MDFLGQDDASPIPSVFVTKARINWVLVAATNVGGITRLAELVGTSRETVHTWARRGSMENIDVQTVAKVARVGMVGMDDLTGISDIPALATRKTNRARKRRPKPKGPLN